MRRYLYLFTLCAAVLIGFLLAFGSDILQSGVALAASAYATIDSAGVALTQRTVLNFVNGGCVDNAGASRTDCTITGPTGPTGATGATGATGGGGGGSFIQPLTAPVSGNFTNLNFNVGTGVVTTRVNQSSPVAAITLDQVDPNHTGNTAAFQKAITNAAFTATIGISTASQPPTGAIVGLWLGDGTTNGLFWGFYNQSALIVNVITSLTNSGSGSSNPYLQTPYQPNGPLLWLRIQETVSARNYYISADGVTFDLVFTEANTAHFTTVNYGAGTYLFNGAGSSQLSMYSFSETSP